MSNGNVKSDSRIIWAALIALVGLAAIGVLAMRLPVSESWKPSEVNALIATVTTFLGTTVGAFLGVQVAAAGQERAEKSAERAQQAATEALSELTHEQRLKVMDRIR